jgi:hypothetical protein
MGALLERRILRHLPPLSLKRHAACEQDWR